MPFRLPRLKRFLGFAIIAAIWAGFLGLAGFFALTYAVYADLKSPNRSHLTHGTYGEFLAAAMYRSLFGPWWPGENGGEFDAQLIYVPKPGVNRFRGPEFDVQVLTTPERMRAQPTPDLEKMRSGLVVVAGDSFTFGLGVNDAETYSALLQTRYHHRTVNTGVSSYGTARELTRLRREGLLPKASVVIIQYCTNDVGENRFFLSQGGDQFVTPETKANWERMAAYQPIELSYARVLGGVTKYLRRRVAAVGVSGLWQEIAHERHPPRRLYENRIEGMADDFLAVLDRFAELEGKPIIVTELNDHGVTTGFLSALKTKCADRPNIRIVPLQFEPGDHFRFNVHLNASGHQKAAEQLDRALREMTRMPL